MEFVVESIDNLLKIGGVRLRVSIKFVFVDY